MHLKDILKLGLPLSLLMLIIRKIFCNGIIIGVKWYFLIRKTKLFKKCFAFCDVFASPVAALLFSILFTYIIGHYNTLVRITTQFLTPLMLRELILYTSGGSYSFKSSPNDWFLRNFS